MSGPALALLAEARRLGLTLRADADTIRYRPKDRMVGLIAGRGLHLERAEGVAMTTILRRMVATGELQTEGW